MVAASFVHLRSHSAFSLSQSTLRIGTLADLAGNDEQVALAITDSFNMFGALEFSKKVADKGIQPIIGAVVRLCDEVGDGEVVLLATSEEGYINLSFLISEALMAADSGEEAAITMAALEERHQGLILLTGGAHEGFIGNAAAQNQVKLASERLQKLMRFMKDRIYIELQRHGHSEEKIAEPVLLKLADDTGLPLVATNDNHFENEDMKTPQNVLTCIAASTRISQLERLVHNAEYRFKTKAEMTAVFADIPEALQNSVTIAKRCAFMVQTRAPILPAFESEAGRTADEELAHQAKQGLAMRLIDLKRSDYGKDFSAEDEASYHDRLAYELSVINEMGFPGYFLIVADFIKWAKAKDIPVGPGRGSGAGSLVAYALDITNLDPLRWGLLFERFLNPERVSMPDFDIDFCQDRREEVKLYVQDKYGHDRVAQIITFGSLQARAALRDVGRVLEMPYGQVDRIAKLIPSNPANPVTISQALESEAELREMKRSDEQVRHLIDTAMKLEGLYRHASTHAAGLVISDRPLPELVPVYRDPRSDMPATQFNMKYVEMAGLVKFDFLGLKTLTVIKKTLQLMANRGISLQIDDIPLDDQKTFALLTEGDTVGVFQLESSGMRDVLRGLKPDRFEDIIAVVALYRPGPMENIPTYIERKHGREEVSYMHPKLEPILAETYGIMIYQEQVQQAARDLAGYTLGGADILRRAMGKKIKEEMDAQRQKFVEGAASTNQIAEALSGNIFDQIAAFAGYGFNKSHAAAYALVTYQTAWLKANYPVEFFAASMALDSHNTDKLSVFRQDCLHKNIAVQGVDINKSFASFSVEGEADNLSIRYALGAVKNVGSEAMESLCQERLRNGPFTSLDDFIKRLPKDGGNKRQLENLIRAGGLDSIHKNRRQLYDNVDQIISQASFYRKEADSSQVSLFGGQEQAELDQIKLPPTQDWSPNDRLQNEFESLGLYLSAHPLDSYARQIARLKVISSDQIEAVLAQKGPHRLKVAGQLTSVQERVSAKGNRFAFLQFTDKSGVFEMTAFSEFLQQNRDILVPDTALLVHADARNENGQIRLLGVRAERLDDAIAASHEGIGLYVSQEAALANIKDILKADGGGRAPVKIFVKKQNEQVEITLSHKFKLSGDTRLALMSVPGIDKITEI
ncbi:MAG: DNA polymerase III subunit alpha [Candidatus Puniceispirillaceae bacterium]